MKASNHAKGIPMGRLVVGRNMCPHCGRLFNHRYRLIPKHRAKGETTDCEGTHQAPRNPNADRRKLWNGKPNPWLDADGNPIGD